MELIGLIVVGRRITLPLKSCTVNAEVQGYVVGLNSTLKYVNDGDKPVEVLFRFPVDESYAVVGMEAVIDGRKIKAEIKKKEEAKQDYRKAITSGHTAALAQEKSGDIFSISLGNLSVHAEAELHLKLVGELPIDAEGGVRFTLPAVLKPRYTPVGSKNPLAPKQRAIHGVAPAVYDFKMAVKSDSVSDVTSPTHTISVDRDRDVINVSLSNDDAEPLTKDLVVLIGQAEPHAPKVMYELGDPSKSQRSYMGAPAVMLSFFPKFEVKRAACEFIFLVDRSGSMRGSYISSASETLVLFLKSIPPGCIFNIVGFGSSYTSLFRESVPYNQKNLDYAVRHAESLQADLGGTELLHPLKHIFAQDLLPDLPRQVFVLTDGSVSNTQLCIDEVSKNSAKCRVFTFGIGSGASTSLVNGLARAGRGTSEFIKEGERMQPKVIGSLKRALQPSVTELQVNFDLPSGFEAFQAPANIATLFNGDKVVVYGILKSKAASDTPLQTGIEGRASLKYEISDQTITHSISFEIPARPLIGEDQLKSSTEFSLPIIHHLAAKSLLSDWKAGKGWASTALTQEREQESTNLSIESSVICEHTAFVAVDEVQKKGTEESQTVHDITATIALSDRYEQERGRSSPRLWSNSSSSGNSRSRSGSYSAYRRYSRSRSSSSSSSRGSRSRRRRYSRSRSRSRGYPRSPKYRGISRSRSRSRSIGISRQRFRKLSRSRSRSGSYSSYRRYSRSRSSSSSRSRGSRSRRRRYSRSQSRSRGYPRSPKSRGISRSRSRSRSIGTSRQRFRKWSRSSSRSRSRSRTPRKSKSQKISLSPRCSIHKSRSRQKRSRSRSRNLRGECCESGFFSEHSSKYNISPSNFDLDQDPGKQSLNIKDPILLISLQHASGYWVLADVCKKILHKAEDEVKCPVDDVPTKVWATILALVYLETYFSQNKDEWELVACKGESWIKKQSLPQNFTINSIKELAKTILSS